MDEGTAATRERQAGASEGVPEIRVAQDAGDLDAVAGRPHNHITVVVKEPRADESGPALEWPHKIPAATAGWSLATLSPQSPYGS